MYRYYNDNDDDDYNWIGKMQRNESYSVTY